MKIHQIIGAELYSEYARKAENLENQFSPPLYMSKEVGIYFWAFSHKSDVVLCSALLVSEVHRSNHAGS